MSRIQYLACMAFSASCVLAAQPAVACDPANNEQRATISDEIRDEYNAVREAEKKRKQEINAKADALVDSGSWTAEQRTAFFANPEIKALNEPRTAALQGYLKQMYVVTHPAPKADDGFCEHSSRAREQIKAMEKAGQERDVSIDERLNAAAGS